jgi:hypothetical protein
MSKFFGTKYSRYKADGSDAEFKPTVERLAEFLNDPSQSATDKARAAAILRVCVEREKASAKPEITRWLNELDASSLWEWPEHYQLQDVVGKDGGMRKECVCVVPFAPVATMAPSQPSAAPVTDDI